MDTTDPPHEGDVGSWRERAVERSLRTARAKAVSRSDRFIATAVQILVETGRTDFTVQELVERSQTSLRSFYQHFSSKDELLLALFEEILATSTAQWRERVAGVDALGALRMVVEEIHDRTGTPTGAGVNRALSAYHLQLAESRPGDYARVLAPLRNLIRDLVQRGVAEGSLRTDLDPDVLAVLLMQTLVGTAHLQALRAELCAGPMSSEWLWEFCAGGLLGRRQ